MENVLKIGIGIKVAKSDPIIPYLMFPDDYLTFCKQTGSGSTNKGYHEKLL